MTASRTDDECSCCEGTDDEHATARTAKTTEARTPDLPIWASAPSKMRARGISWRQHRSVRFLTRGAHSSSPRRSLFARRKVGATDRRSAMKPPPPTSRSVQYVVRLGSSERAQLEAILAHEHRRRGEPGTSVTIAEVLRIIIAEAAKRRGCHPEHDGGRRRDARVEGDDDSGVRIEVRRGSGKPARSRRS